MKFTCNTVDFGDAAAVLARIVKPGGHHPMICINATDGEGVTLYGTDGMMAIRATVPAEVEAPGACAVEGRMLSDAADKMPAGDMRCELSSGSLTLRAGSARIRLAATLDGPYKHEMELRGEGVGYRMDAEAFCGSVKRVRHAVGTESTRVILTGILMEVSRERLCMVACDGYRLARCEAACEGPEEELLYVLPCKSAAEVVGIIKKSGMETVRVTTDKQALLLEAGRYTVRCALLAGDYIAYEHILPKQFATQARVPTASLREAIDMVNIMARYSKNTPITIEFSPISATLTSVIDVGSVCNTVSCDLSGDPLTISFNGSYLLEALKAFDKDDVIIEMNSATTAAVIRAVDMMELVLPVRMQRE